MKRNSYMTNSKSYFYEGAKAGDILKRKSEEDTVTILILEKPRECCRIESAHHLTQGKSITGDVGTMKDDGRYITNSELKEWEVIENVNSILKQGATLTKKDKRSRSIELLSYQPYFQNWLVLVADTSNAYSVKKVHETIKESDIIRDYDDVAGGGRFMGEMNREAF